MMDSLWSVAPPLVASGLSVGGLPVLGAALLLITFVLWRVRHRRPPPPGGRLGWLLTGCLIGGLLVIAGLTLAGRLTC